MTIERWKCWLLWRNISTRGNKLNLVHLWIGGTYDKVKCKSLNSVQDDEEVVAIIALGYTRESKE